MSYYQRPMGDYKTYGYAGDPGFLSGLWKGIKKVGKAAIGYYTGGVAGAVMSQMGGGKPQPPAQMPVPMGQVRGLQTVQGYPVGMSLTMPGGLSLAAQGTIGGGRSPHAPGRPAPAMAPGGMVPSGYHYAKDGSGRMVRNRRMNVANPRALRKAMRRVQGFEKLAKRTIVFTRRTRLKKRKSS